MRRKQGYRVKTTFLIIFILVIVFGIITAISGQETRTPDVLLIYSSGTPYVYTKGEPPKDYDALSCPTPKKENVRTVAEKLGNALKRKNLVVCVAEASEITDHNEILKARMIIIGSPSYLGNVDWKIKKLLDVTFYPIYFSGKERLGKKRIAAFSMAQIEPSAKKTLEAIKTAAGDYRGTFGPTMIVLVKHPEEEVNKRVNQFAGQIAKEID